MIRNRDELRAFLAEKPSEAINKDAVALRIKEIMSNPEHPYHSKLDTEQRRAAIQEVLRLNQKLTGER